MPIATTEDLRSHIELAIQIELSTIPPYLFAMYSIENETSEAALLIRSIVAEEMLHAALATNLLLSVGGRPDFRSTTYVAEYPLDLPHHKPPLRIDLAPCSLESIRSVFMRIEKPGKHGAPPQPDEYETLGQFYHALEQGLRDVAVTHSLFSQADTEAQLSDESFYAPVAFDADDSGGLILIDDLDSAIEAIEVIVHQGEGLSDHRWADSSHRELTHYHKLLQISSGQSPLGGVIAVRSNPKTVEYPPDVAEVAVLFNACYRYLFTVMQTLFTPGTDQGAWVDRLYRLMTRAMSPIALYLVQQPIGDGHFGAPTFEIYEFESDDHSGELQSRSDAVVAKHADLLQVGETIARL